MTQQHLFQKSKLGHILTIQLMKIKVSNTFLLNLCIQVVCLYLSVQSESITMIVTVSLSGEKITATTTALHVNSSAGNMPRALLAKIQRKCCCCLAEASSSADSRDLNMHPPIMQPFVDVKRFVCKGLIACG